MTLLPTASSLLSWSGPIVLPMIFWFAHSVTTSRQPGIRFCLFYGRSRCVKPWSRPCITAVQKQCPIPARSFAINHLSGLQTNANLTSKPVYLNDLHVSAVVCFLKHGYLRRAFPKLSY